MSSDIADPSDGSQGELPESPGGGLTNDLSYEDTASDSDDHIGNYFPDDAFCRVSQSLANAQHHNLPLNSLIACLRASLATLGKFVRDGQVTNEVEVSRRFVRGDLPLSFDKLLRDEEFLAIHQASGNFVCEAVLLMLDLAGVLVSAKCRAVLGVAYPPVDPDPYFHFDAGDFDREVMDILQCVLGATDPRAELHQSALAQSLPPVAPEPAAGAGVRLQPMDARPDEPPSRWLPIFVYCSYRSTTLLRDASRLLTASEDLPFGMLEPLLMLVAHVVPCLEDGVHRMFAEGVGSLLDYVTRVVEEGQLDRLTDGGRDLGFQTFSRVVDALHLALLVQEGRVKADEMVTPLHRRFVEVMLGSSSFNRLLAGVRECERLLARSRDLHTADAGKAMSGNLAWMESRDVVRQMLRSNLHQQQYADLVLAIFGILTHVGAVKDEHLDLLWSVTQKPDTFDVVRTNVYHMLAEIAGGLEVDQLDTLFSKFTQQQTQQPQTQRQQQPSGEEGGGAGGINGMGTSGDGTTTAAARSAFDVYHQLELLKRLASKDCSGGDMAERLLSLIWDLTVPANAPFSHLSCLPDVLQEYDDQLGPDVAVPHVRTYIQRCIEQLQARRNLYASMFVLRSLLHIFPARRKKQRPPGQLHSGEVMRLITQHSILPLLIKNLRWWMDGARRALQAAANAVAADAPGRGGGGRLQAVALPCEGQYSYQDVTDFHVRLLLQLAHAASRAPAGPDRPDNWQLPRRFVLALWDSLVVEHVTPQDQHQGWHFATDVLDFVDDSTMEELMTSRMTALPADQLAERTFVYFEKAFSGINEQLGRLENAAASQEERYLVRATGMTDDQVLGLSYVWQAALDAVNGKTCNRAVKLLLTTYAYEALLAPQYYPLEVELHQACVRRVTTVLSGALRVLRAARQQQGGVAASTETLLAPPDAQAVATAQRHATRCLKLLTRMVNSNISRTMPSTPSHSASYRGASLQLPISVHVNNMRFTIGAHSNEYVGSVRRRLAELLHCAPQRLRLITAGKEWDNDAAQLSDVYVRSRNCISVTISPQDNAFTVLSPHDSQFDEAASPSRMLSKVPGLYDDLLFLADLVLPPSLALSTLVACIRRDAGHLLAMLPSWTRTPLQLHEALSATDAAVRLRAALVADAHRVQPAHTLYALQVLYGILFPVPGSAYQAIIDRATAIAALSHTLQQQQQQQQQQQATPMQESEARDDAAGVAMDLSSPLGQRQQQQDAATAQRPPQLCIADPSAASPYSPPGMQPQQRQIVVAFNCIPLLSEVVASMDAAEEPRHVETVRSLYTLVQQLLSSLYVEMSKWASCSGAAARSRGRGAAAGGAAAGEDTSMVEAGSATPALSPIISATGKMAVDVSGSGAAAAAVAPGGKSPSPAPASATTGDEDTAMAAGGGEAAANEVSPEPQPQQGQEDKEKAAARVTATTAAASDDATTGAGSPAPLRASSVQRGGTPAPVPVELDPAVTAELVRLLVRIIHDAAQLWGELDVLEDDLDHDIVTADVTLVHEAFALMARVLVDHPPLRDVLLTHPDAPAMIRALTLNPAYSHMRSAATECLPAICAAEPPSAAPLWLLRQLMALRPVAASPAHAHHSREYHECMMRTLHMAVQLLPEHQATYMALAQDLLTREVSELVRCSQELTAPNHAVLLEGRLRLVHDLVTLLDRSVQAVEAGLLRALLVRYLFPEADAMKRLAAAAAAAGGGSPNAASAGPAAAGGAGSSSPVAIIAPGARASLITSALDHCTADDACRAAALDLAQLLMTSCHRGLDEGVALLVSHHYCAGQRLLAEQAWQLRPPPPPRSPESYVGLKNAGATCYMNSVLQQLFMQPRIRRLVLATPSVPAAEQPDSLFHQLRAVFAHLSESRQSFVVPSGFWAAFKDYDGRPIDLREHQDVYEFFTRLQDVVDQHSRCATAGGALLLGSVLGGKFANQIICRDVGYRSEREEEFYQISVDVKGKGSLERSLESYVRGELLEGENAYFCEDVGRRVTAVKRTCIKQLPDTLAIHLKRFEYDYHNMVRYKVRDRFEFPHDLDMFPYTADGLAALDAQQKSAAAAAASSSGGGGGAGVASIPPPPHPPAHYRYRLCGVVVHSGTAFAGHYYSYIRERSAGSSADGAAVAPGADSEEGNWFCFDDRNVTPWDPRQLEQDCYGGRNSQDRGARQHRGPNAPPDVERPHSAYMLFYERVMQSPLQPLPQAKPSEEDAAMQQAVAMSLEGEPGAGGAAAAAGAGPAAEEGLVHGMPSRLYDAVMEANLSYAHHSHLLDKDYFRFVRQVVAEAKVDADDGGQRSSKARRRGEAPLPAHSAPSDAGPPQPAASASGAAAASAPQLEVPASSASGYESPSSRAHLAQEADDAAVLAMRLAVHFLFTTFMPADKELIADLQHWEELMRRLCAGSPAACVEFMRCLAAPANASWLPTCFLSRGAPGIVQEGIHQLLRICLDQAVAHGLLRPGGAAAAADCPLAPHFQRHLVVVMQLAVGALQTGIRNRGLYVFPVIQLLSWLIAQPMDSHLVAYFVREQGLLAEVVSFVDEMLTGSDGDKWQTELRLCLRFVGLVMQHVADWMPGVLRRFDGLRTLGDDRNPFCRFADTPAAELLDEPLYRRLTSEAVLQALVRHSRLRYDPECSALLCLLCWSHPVVSKAVITCCLVMLDHIPEAEVVHQASPLADFLWNVTYIADQLQAQRLAYFFTALISDAATGQASGLTQHVLHAQRLRAAPFKAFVTFWLICRAVRIAALNQAGLNPLYGTLVAPFQTCLLLKDAAHRIAVRVYHESQQASRFPAYVGAILQKANEIIEGLHFVPGAPLQPAVATAGPGAADEGGAAGAAPPSPAVVGAGSAGGHHVILGPDVADDEATAEMEEDALEDSSSSGITSSAPDAPNDSAAG